MRRILPVLLLLVLSSLTSAVTAAPDKENTYTVEILVFSTRLPQFGGNELWTRETIDAGTSLRNDASGPSRTAPPGILSAAANDLTRDGRFRILAYYSWIQSADAKSASKPVRIRGTGGKNPDELDGSMRLYLSRYLHLDLNLGYQDNAGDGAQYAGGSDMITYRINEQRRVKSQETHYFDHPKFGALVRLTPLPSGK